MKNDISISNATFVCDCLRSNSHIVIMQNQMRVQFAIENLNMLKTNIEHTPLVGSTTQYNITHSIHNAIESNNTMFLVSNGSKINLDLVVSTP